MKLHLLFFLIISVFVGTLMAANTENGPSGRPPGPPPNGERPSGPPPNGQKPPNSGNNSG